jgi:hypothetical protein
MTNQTQTTLFLRRMVSLVAAVALAACGQSDLSGRIVGGTTKQMTDDVQPTRGFLPQPDLLQPGGSGQAALVYRVPDARFASYTKVILDPVIIRAASDSALSTVPAGEREALAERFYSDLYKALANRCQMVRSRSPGTLRLRFALVDATSPNAAVNTVATYAPYVSTASSLASLAFNKGVGFFAGTATAEGFATDATNGKLLWQAVDKRGGTDALIKNTIGSWVDVDHAFQAWSDQLASKMQQLGVCRA